MPQILDDVLAALPFHGAPVLFDDIRPTLDRNEVRTALFGLLSMGAVAIKNNGWYRTDKLPAASEPQASSVVPVSASEYLRAAGAETVTLADVGATGTLDPLQHDDEGRAALAAVFRAMAATLTSRAPLTESQRAAAGQALSTAAAIVEGSFQ